MAVLSAIVVAFVAVGGIGVYVALSGHDGLSRGPGEPAGTPSAAPVDTGTPRAAAMTVVNKLNERDLAGLMALTCGSGQEAGRKALTDAVPSLDPAGSPDDAEATLRFALDDVVEDRSGEAVATVTALPPGRPDGAARHGQVLLLRENDRWTLCGLTMTNPPLQLSPQPNSGDSPAASLGRQDATS